MKTLEACYEIEFSKVDFQERKECITHPKTILFGPPKSGKSYLIYDYLSNFKSEDYLYINLEDIRNNKEEIKTNLELFIKQNSIKVLVIESFDFDFELPIVDSIVITVKELKELKGFKNLNLNPLDFEEFLLFDNKSQNVTNSFNNFFKYGNLPQTVHTDETKKIMYLQNKLKEFTKNPTNLEIFKILLEQIDEKKSFYQLFTSLKNRIKISKDIFYALCKEYEQNKIFHFIQKYNQPNAPKKIYCYNHGFFGAISYIKKFKQEFTNMLFLELYYKYSEIFYLDGIDFYIPKSKIAIFSIPFFNESHISIIKKRVKQQKEVEISQIFIITISNSQPLFLEDLQVEVLPFYEWALS